VTSRPGSGSRRAKTPLAANRSSGRSRNGANAICDAFWWSEPARYCDTRAISRRSILGSRSFWRVLREQIVILHRRLLAIVRDDEVCGRLMTTPGVGPVVALTYRATVDVPARFRKSKAVGAVFGLTCSKYQSWRQLDRARCRQLRLTSSERPRHSDVGHVLRPAELPGRQGRSDWRRVATVPSVLACAAAPPAWRCWRRCAGPRRRVRRCPAERRSSSPSK
jgi:Transposase IS116/IS110/IS902 family